MPELERLRGVSETIDNAIIEHEGDARLPAIDATIKILRKRVIHGPNPWSRLPLVRLVVDLGPLEELPSNMIPGFPERLVDTLPGLALHACASGKPGGFVARVIEGTWMGHVVRDDPTCAPPPVARP